jgi:thiosulfate/3-mercaptopyruvate sulfurtransferase
MRLISINKKHLILSIWATIFLFSCSRTDNEIKTAKKDYSLISASELSNMNSSNVVIVDLQDRDDYHISHIANAVNIPREQIKFEAFKADGSSSKKELETILGKVGIKPTDQIIAYDNKHNSDASRFWWLLKLFGHEKVALLDGGFSFWKESGNELTAALPDIKPVYYHFTGKERKDIFADINDVKEGLKDKNTVLLDVRSLEEYDGTKLKDGAMYAGNINDCTNLDFKTSLNEGGSNNQCFKNIETLKKMFEEEGLTKNKKIIVYCHSGTRSAHTTFVLTELLGYTNVSNYDGSWVEWTSSGKITKKNE